MLNGYKWEIILRDLDNKLRATTKYEVGILNENEKAGDLEMQIADKIRTIIRELTNENGIEF